MDEMIMAPSDSPRLWLCSCSLASRLGAGLLSLVSCFLLLASYSVFLASCFLPLSTDLPVSCPAEADNRDSSKTLEQGSSHPNSTKYCPASRRYWQGIYAARDTQSGLLTFHFPLSTFRFPLFLCSELFSARDCCSTSISLVRLQLVEAGKARAVS